MAGGAFALRAGRDDDTDAYIRLIGDAWGEFPGVVFDVDAELPELRALATYFSEKGGSLWLAEGPDGPLGMVATRPLREDGAWEIGRMYVAAAARGTGLAHRLLDTAEAHARAQGAERMVLWTDTRFNAAHSFYEKRGYVRQGAIRILDDLSKSLEFRYAKPAQGLVVEALDAAAAASAERRFSEILVACVAAGASTGFLAPLSPDKSRAHWKRVSAEVAQGHRVLLGAWLEGALVGTVQLDLATPEDQQHRAGLVKLLADPAFRRRGVGEALLRRAEQTALRLGRRLITLEAEAGGEGERLCRRLGWTEGGCIPDFAQDAAGQPRAVLFFYKRPG